MKPGELHIIADEDNVIYYYAAASLGYSNLCSDEVFMVIEQGSPQAWMCLTKHGVKYVTRVKLPP